MPKITAPQNKTMLTVMSAYPHPLIPLPYQYIITISSNHPAVRRPGTALIDALGRAPPAPEGINWHAAPGAGTLTTNQGPGTPRQRSSPPRELFRAGPIRCGTGRWADQRRPAPARPGGDCYSRMTWRMAGAISASWRRRVQARSGRPEAITQLRIG